MSERPRIAFVVQRCGAEVNGGAEALCRDVAIAMSSVWDVTVLSTTARDYETWAPYYPEGETNIGDVCVRRFNVDSVRSKGYFDGLSAKLLGRLPSLSLTEQREWMRAQGPYSTALLRYIEDHQNEFDLFVFYTYLYATTYFALPLVAGKAFLVPFAHDEWPIHLPMWDVFFRLPQRIIYSTPEERDFIAARFRGIDLAGPIIGIGVNIPTDVKPNRFRDRFGIGRPYVIYVGRIDLAKGCDQLLIDFAAYKHFYDDDLCLVMLGRQSIALPALRYLRVLGYVDEEAKIDAIAASELLVMPSCLESLSIVLLEAWSVGRPVLVNAASDVLVGQSRRAGGGLWYSDPAEFAAATKVLRGEIGLELGSSGQRFVRERYSWPVIVAAYESVYSQFAQQAPDAKGPGDESLVLRPSR